MRHATGGDLAPPPVDPAVRSGSDPTAGGNAVTDADASAGGDVLDRVVAEASALLARPGLVVVHGGPGCGRSTVLRRLGAAFRGPVFTGGGLASLQTMPAFALTRAVRARLPVQDPALLAEAVRSRVRGGLLLLDDLQWADPATVAALTALLPHCRIAAALRTPNRLPTAAVAALRAGAAGWLPVPPLDRAGATALAAAAAPTLDPATLAEVVRHGGGVPLAVTALARHAAGSRSGAGAAAGGRHDVDQVGYAVAVALADLSRPARTALAALGLLGRPAPAALLGAGVDELAAAGLVTNAPATVAVPGVAPTGDAAAGAATGVRPVDGTSAPDVAPVSPYLAEVAAGLLDEPGRRALHRRLAALVPAGEAARHLAAAGAPEEAYRLAVAAAERAATTGDRADLLLLACGLPGVDPPETVRVDAGRAALACGRSAAAARALAGVTGPAGTVLRAEALLHAGDLPAARAAAEAVPADVPDEVAAGRDRVLLLARLAQDPAAAGRAAAEITARHGRTPPHPGLRAALAAVAAAVREPGWEYALASAAGAAGADDPLAARWSAWLLVETLAADGRLAEAERSARSAAQACAADLAYSWQVRFVAAGLWCAALRGDPTAGGPTTGGEPPADPPPADPGEVLRRAGDLTDRTLPAAARGYAVAAVSLVEADGGLLGPARARLSGLDAGPVAALLDWVRREAAWLDGQPDRAARAAVPGGPPLVDGLGRITARWARHDGADPPADPAGVPAWPQPVRATLAAWADADGAAVRFTDAAAAWRPVAVREQVRCLLAAGLHEPDRDRAVPALLAAERLAERAGLVVLLGRVRRALRRHAVRRDGTPTRTGGDLTGRERDVLRLVAGGEPTRRIAGRLGISVETVETHVRSGMRKLGARTRTEAAALALAGPG
ncbi:LuxR C-terminal-related transcriptional regulator [Solwaraspora sp. WMMD1047]|uniref:helix-turn-helix transcriptional regulator n=1 Tax=Solwaraspora sp. WMMD1047 TaxID=3016102 RepID=UPI0024179593|nr:LuxR C-terminal-related transcriptional regulator [Solwaraspora sp. WMMD1047]MDG4831057.1 LuxR C-terminal-related transcriptional regulator [Solwaraspora sp. WMMD1047]